MPEKVPVLIMIQGHEPGARWKLDQTRVTTLGRSSRNQIKLVHPSVSRFHCEISYINGLWYVADLNSKKGTYLNGREVTEREVLKPGDVIRLSNNVFKFDLVQEETKEEEDLRAIREAYAGSDVSDSPGDTGGSSVAAPPEEPGVQLGEMIRPYAEIVIFVAIVATIVFGLVSGALAYANHRVQKIRVAQHKRQQTIENALEAAAEMAQQEPPPYEEVFQELREIVRKYPGTPEAEKAAELYQRLEVQKFESDMRAIRQEIDDRDYRAAYEMAGNLQQLLVKRYLKGYVRDQREYTLRLARSIFAAELETARRLAQERRMEEAITQAQDVLERLAATPEMRTQASELLDKLKQVHERGEAWNEKGNGAVSDEEMRRRMRPPDEANWR